MKKIIIALVIIGMLTPLVVFAGTSGKVKITGIRVQGNRTWISFSPEKDLSCGNLKEVEVANSHPNQKLVVSMAMSAMLAGKDVVWIYTPGNCSNVDKNIINGIKVFP